MFDRAPGRFRLHRLGWYAFEDLCMQVMRVVLGETCTRFTPGPDGGRDGWFQGTASAALAVGGATGAFVVQCKHTSAENSALSIGELRQELEKVERLAKKGPLHYVLMTNRRVSAIHEASIRAEFESIAGVESSRVLAETWIEDTIDAHPRLLRLVPRLYGIGDLSQILSVSLQQQTAALLEDLAHSLRTFVPTDSYRRAERAMHERGFVVLVGPPASGKSAIAANLCMVRMAQDPDVRVLRVEHADEFKKTWSPSDAKTIYWVDDVFGETTLDQSRLREWSVALEKIDAARRRGALIVFCTRDYIFSEALQRLKPARGSVLNDASVRVDVTALTAEERDGILYNHVKEGDLQKASKASLKRYLPAVARLSTFSPELARRLGSQRFFGQVEVNWESIDSFFEKPVEHFRDVIHGLSDSETAALAVCLMNNNSVPDPVPAVAMPEAVIEAYDVSASEVRLAFDRLEGSLVKRVRNSVAQTWQLHHPSMIEALQTELAQGSSKMALYVQGAQVLALLRDTTTNPARPGERLVFLPNHIYRLLIQRMQAAVVEHHDAVGLYLVERGSDELLTEIDQGCPSLLDVFLASPPEPEGPELAARLAIRLATTRPRSLLTQSRNQQVVSSLDRAADRSGWMGFVDEEGLDLFAPEFRRHRLEAEVAGGFPALERLFDWLIQDLSSLDILNSADEAMQSQINRLRAACEQHGLTSEDTDGQLESWSRSFQQRFEERRAELEEEEDRRADFYDDDSRERWHERNYESQHGRFADVDE